MDNIPIYNDAEDFLCARTGVVARGNTYIFILFYLGSVCKE